MKHTSRLKLALKSKTCCACLLVMLTVYTIVASYLQANIVHFVKQPFRRSTLEAWQTAGPVYRPDAAGQFLFTTSPWKPKDTELRQLLSYLNLTQQEASSHLPLTLQGPDLLSNDSLCVTEDGSPVDVLFFVHTAPQHFERRQQLRNTFMAEKLFRPLNFKVGATGWERYYQRSRTGLKGTGSNFRSTVSIFTVRMVPNQICVKRSLSSQPEQHQIKSSFGGLNLYSPNSSLPNQIFVRRF